MPNFSNILATKTKDYICFDQFPSVLALSSFYTLRPAIGNGLSEVGIVRNFENPGYVLDFGSYLSRGN